MDADRPTPCLLKAPLEESCHPDTNLQRYIRTDTRQLHMLADTSNRHRLFHDLLQKYHQASHVSTSVPLTRPAPPHRRLGHRDFEPAPLHLQYQHLNFRSSLAGLR